MKNVSKILIIFVYMMFVVIHLKAAEIDDSVSATNKLCIDGVEYSGCTYNKNDKLYIKSGTSLRTFKDDSMYSKGPAITVAADIPLTTAYQVLDKTSFGNNTYNAIYGGCYMGYLEKTIGVNGWNSFKVVANQNSNTIGTAYYFKIVVPGMFSNNNNMYCKKYVEGLVLDENIKPTDKTPGYEDDDLKGMIRNKDGYEYADVAIAEFNKKANKNYIDFSNFDTKAQRCPKYFVVVPNSSDFLDKANHYFFNDTGESNFKENIITALTGFENYNVSVMGCTEEDKKGEEEARQLFEAKANEILELKEGCSNEETLKKIAVEAPKACESKYEVAYSKKLEDRLIDEFTPIIKNAVAKKIEKCELERCKVTEKSDVDKIFNSMNGTICEYGCKIITQTNIENGKCYNCGSSRANNYIWASDNPNSSSCIVVDKSKTECSNDGGKCFACGNSQGEKYMWAVSNPNTAYCKEVSKAKSECSGSTVSSCKTCYEKAYSFLINKDITKYNCLINGVDAKTQKIAEWGNEIQNAFEEDSKSDLENQKIERENKSYKIFYIPPIGSGVGGFGSGSQNCKELLGDGAQVVKGAITIVRIAAAIIAIVNAMIILIPAVISKDADGLKKASSKLVTMAVVLALVGVLPTIIKIISGIFGFDTTCIF